MLGDVRGLPSTCQARALSTHLCVSSGALEGGGGVVRDCLPQRLPPTLERPVPPPGIPAASGPAGSQTVS